MTPAIQAIAESVLVKPHLHNQTTSILAWNFRQVIGIPSFCPRCLLRGERARWVPKRCGEFQRYDCDNCGYWVQER